MRWFLLLSLSLPTFAQHPGLDSLDRLLTRLPATDARRVAVLVERARFHWLGGGDSLSRRDAWQAVRLAKRLGDGRGEGQARLWLARLESESETDFATGYAQLDTVERLARRLRDPSLLGHAYFRRAKLGEENYERQGQTLPLLRQAERYFQQAHDRVGLGLVYEGYGLNALTLGRRAACIEWFLKARRQLEGSGYDWGLRSVVTNLGALYAELNQPEAARRYFSEAEAVADRLHDRRLKAFMLVRQGEMRLDQGQARPALALFEQAAGLQKILHEERLHRTYCFMARAYLSLKQYDKALTYNQMGEKLYVDNVDASEALSHQAQTQYGQIYLAKRQYARVVPVAAKGLAWAETTDLPMMAEQSEYHRQLALAYEHLGQPLKALAHLRKHNQFSDTLFNAELVERSTAARLGLEFEQKEQASKLRQVAQENRIKTLENQQLSRTRNFLLVLLGLGVAAMGYVVWTNRRLRGKNEQLSRKNTEIEAALLKGQTIERKRVASELHDSVAARVSAFKWQLEALNIATLPEAEQRFHARLVSQMEDIYEDVRSISHNLMPEIMEKQGLQSALVELGDALNNQYRTRFLLDLANSGEVVRGKKAYELYAITLELVNNVLKHAGAKQATISVRRLPEGLQLSVRDDGRGIVSGKSSEGVGMANLRSRVESLKGQLSFEKADGGGTAVVVLV